MQRPMHRRDSARQRPPYTRDSPRARSRGPAGRTGSSPVRSASATLARGWRFAFLAPAIVVDRRFRGRTGLAPRLQRGLSSSAAIVVGTPLPRILVARGQGRGARSRVRLHRRLLQPASHPLRARLSLAGRVRGEARAGCVAGEQINPSIKPGQVHLRMYTGWRTPSVAPSSISTSTTASRGAACAFYIRRTRDRWRSWPLSGERGHRPGTTDTRLARRRTRLRRRHHNPAVNADRMRTVRCVLCGRDLDEGLPFCEVGARWDERNPDHAALQLQFQWSSAHPTSCGKPSMRSFAHRSHWRRAPSLPRR